MTTVIEQAENEEQLREKILAEIRQLLLDMAGKKVDTLILYACDGDTVMYRYIGLPAELWNLAHVGHEHVLGAFKLEAAAPLPGQRFN